MLTNTRRTWSLAMAATAAVLGVGSMAVTVTGCSDDAPASSTTKQDSGTKPAADSGPSTKDSGAASTLYTRLGGKAGIKGAVDLIVAEEVKDPEIASYFFAQVATPVPAGHPTVAQISACLVNQLGNAAGGPEAYPGVPADNEGFQCRSMTASHANLGIPGGVFDKFVTIAAGVLTKAGVASADVATIGGVLNGTRSAIVTDTTRDGGAFMPRDAGPG